MELEPHPAADMFPLLGAKRYEALLDDIREHGLHEPIVLYDGKIVDGRNRFRACRQLGIEPRFVDAVGDPYAFVWSTNGQRRDLSDDLRSLVWLYVSDGSVEWKAEQEAIRAEGNRKRSETQKGIPIAERGATGSGTTLPPQRSSEAAAKAIGTNRGSIERMATLKGKRPDLALRVRLGELKPTAAMRLMKKDEVEAKVAALPGDIFRVIYADPPWQYNDERSLVDDQEIDRASTSARGHYPTLPTSKICALDIKSLAAPDAVLFCWATFPLLSDALEVVEAWGFKYKTAFVWDKGRGTFGHYHKAEAELLLVGTRGSCTPDSDIRENQIQRWSRARHSEKPGEAAEMIDRLYPHGPRIELFCRGEPPEGWVGWGAELDAAE